MFIASPFLIFFMFFCVLKIHKKYNFFINYSYFGMIFAIILNIKGRDFFAENFIKIIDFVAVFCYTIVIGLYW